MQARLALKYLRIFILVLVSFPRMVAAQGSLVLVGGGSEAEGGWSDASYRWIIDHAANKRVAVISYADEDNWIPDYFVSLGAVAATNIRISSRSVADLQATYDALMTYDAFFFKGGDQSVYYKEYKGTKAMQAAIDKFNAGGVMSGTSAGMAILSGVVYTAEGGSAYPDETLANVYDKDITLADDMFAFLPGFLADSHFTERGRVGRLLPFLARWYLDRNELITGIGVDDRTALCIDPGMRAEVFGTGSVSFYRSSGFGVVRDEVPVADSVHAIQLLHGHRIDLSTLQVINGPVDAIAPTDETGNYTVALGGGPTPEQNTALLNFIVAENGSVDDTVVVVTAPGKGKTFAQKIINLGGRTLLVETSASSNDISQLDLRNAIRRSGKILFAENDDILLFSFLYGGPTGELLRSHLSRNGMINAFVGEDSRYAGKSFTTNHRMDQYAAYYGRLMYRKGLSLLSTSVIMANTFDSNTTDFYENTTASVPFAMVNDSARYGVYLNARNFLKFYQQDGHNYFKAAGSQSVIILINNGTRTAVAEQSVSNGASARDYAGFTSMQYVLLSGAQSIQAGIPIIKQDPPYAFEHPIVGVDPEFNQSSIQAFPNPSRDGRFQLSGFSGGSERVTLVVSDLMGRKVKEQQIDEQDEPVDISSLSDGVYLLRVGNAKGATVLKLFKQGN
jgi:cyanophycinase